MARNYARRLGSDYDLEPRGSAVSCTSQGQLVSHHLQVWYYAVLRGGALIDTLYRCTAVHEYLKPFVFSPADCLRVMGMKIV